jgi:hypothetical protein
MARALKQPTLIMAIQYLAGKSLINAVIEVN